MAAVHLPIIRVPRTSGPRCLSPNPATLRPCYRAEGHTGRHYFAYIHLVPPAPQAGQVREVWGTVERWPDREVWSK